MSRQGYLILHEKRHGARVCYFSLEDGYLRYYASAECAKQLGEVRLSGCKIVVKAQRRIDNTPNSFFLETRKVNVKDRSYTLGAPVRLELSGHSNEDRQDWGKVLFSWQRYYWREPSSSAYNQDSERAALAKTQHELEQIIQQFHHANDGTSSNQTGSSVVGSTASAALSAAKQPLTFLRKKSTSLRRSFSMYMPSTTTSSTTPASSSSTGKAKADGSSCSGAAGRPEATDCEKVKVVLAKVAYPSGTIYRGDSHQASCAC